MYKLITSVRGCDDLSIGLDRDRNRRQRELTNNKNIKGSYQIRNFLKDHFAFAEQQEKATYGLGYKITLRKNSRSSVLNKDNAVNIGKSKINAIEWYVPHYISSILQQAILSKQILSKTPTELQYAERTVFMKEVNTHKFWTFDLGTQEGINVPIWIIVGFQQKEREGSQKLNKNTFYRPPIGSAQCIIGTEKYPDSAILLNYDDDEYSQGYGQFKEAFRALTSDDILQPYISDNDFRSSNL